MSRRVSVEDRTGRIEGKELSSNGKVEVCLLPRTAKLAVSQNRCFWRIWNMTRMVGMMLLLIGAAGFAMANPVPEIDPGSAGSALALLSGALLVVRGRSKK